MQPGLEPESSELQGPGTELEVHKFSFFLPLHPKIESVQPLSEVLSCRVCAKYCVTGLNFIVAAVHCSAEEQLAKA